MQVLVAGATGRVGKAIIKRLVDEGYDIMLQLDVKML